MRIRALLVYSLTLSLLFVCALTNPSKNESSSERKSKNILFYMGCGSYSMRISIWPLIEALEAKGHKVTFISALPPKTPHPTVVDFVPKKVQDWWSTVNGDISVYDLRKNGQLLAFWFSVPFFGLEVCEKMYEDAEVSEWIKRSHFDLVLVDSFVNECAYGMAHVFKAKMISLSTTSLLPWYYDAFGIPDDSSWAATDISLGLPVREMSFLQRTINALDPVVWKIMREWWYFPKLEKISKNGLGLDTIPSFSELEKNISLVFITSHYSLEFPRAYPPNVLAVGGMAIVEKNEPLPTDIERFIEKGKNGFIYISFGTIGEFSKLDKEVQKAFLEGMFKFPDIQFIWKATDDIGVKLPENFMVLKWAPQQSLLAHPKIKAFITHAGLGGINEATYNAVPMISFPIFAEQDNNAYLLEARGIGMKLEILNLKAEHLETAIREVTTTDKYKRKMQMVSKLFRQRPQAALDTALWWTEFVLDHDAEEISEFLRPSSVNQSWWVRRQLDVWLFVGVVLVAIISVTYYILKLILCSLCKMFVSKPKVKTN